MNALVVDYDQNRARSLRSIWTSLGYKGADLEHAADAPAASALLKKKKFDAIFIHQEVPTAEPFKALMKEIRENSRLKPLPLIVYSGSPSRESVMEAVEAGASSFLAFPFSVSDVEAAIKRPGKA